MKIKWFSFIRVTGLLFVLTYHFFQTSFPGGFIGVDIFFTFSGYLITALMIDELIQRDRFQLKQFYLRRLYRIFPPVLLMVLLTLPFTYLVSPDYITDIGKQIAGALGFTTNYYEILSGGNYEAKFIPHLFIHTWSLAIEVHFYILWGALIYGLSKYKFSAITNKRKKIRSIRQTIFALSFLFFVISYLLCSIGSLLHLNPSFLYFSDITHAFPFFFGSMIACKAGIKTQTKDFKEKAQEKNLFKKGVYLAVILISMIFLGRTLTFDSVWTYRFGLLVTTLLTGAVIYSLRLLHEQTPQLNEPKLVSILANISYGVYLFHWPFYVILNQKMSTLLAVIGTTLLSIVFSLFSYYIVEPFLLGKPIHYFNRRPFMKKGFASVFVFSTLLLTGVLVLRVHEAPFMTQLEESLWISDIVQDKDHLIQLKNKALPSKTTPSIQTKNKYNVPEGISIIGDSVTLGTRESLLQRIPNSEVDAEGNRTLDLAVSVMEQQIKSNTLREYVIICVGTNALDDYEEQTLKLISLLPKGHRLILMTPHNGQATPTWNSSKLAVFERTLPQKYPFIMIADWNKLAPQHKDIFGQGDGTHFGGNENGDALYAQCLLDALKEAKTKPIKEKKNS